MREATIRNKHPAGEKVRIAMSRNAWQETIDQTQLVLRQQSDHCFVCGQPVPGPAPDALLQAYLDAGHQRRLAAVCGRRACRLTLQDAATGR